ncbi:membrane protein insertase YidC [Adhaeribacter soli]|uniref:Membrane protein insertase YidC n=1 Tax=Adhaeribacter soli TaxID=2607655 RepID=A0A5N1J7N9_9BACT|nr:membrane protein insertase YidC [Adhaeribacter soli]KAA9345982.1 membrane protein insertase YidC [Adhaeribacter soli]
MDRNQAVGLFLISALLLVYMFFFAPKDEVQQEKKPAQTTATTTATQPAAAPLDSAAMASRQAAMGTFGAAATGTEQTVVLENENLKVGLTTKGGQVNEVLLKNYLTFDKKPLYLFDKESSATDIAFKTREGKEIKLSDLYFTPTPVSTTNGKTGKTQAISFRATLGEGQYVEQTYSLTEGTFLLGYDLNFKGVEQLLAANQPLTFTWKDRLKKLEMDLAQNRNHSSLNFMTMDEDVTIIKTNSTEEEKSPEPVKWMGNKQNFFTAGIIAKNQFESGQFTSSLNEADSSEVKTFVSALAIPQKDVLGGAQFTYYFGPNDYSVLKHVSDKFEKNLELGWGVFGYINRFVVIPVFHLLENHIASYGIIIVILVLLIKLILTPLTYKSYLSMAKMKVMKPEIDEIKEKYGDDMQKQQSETMKLYSSVGVNPMSGCIPMLLQIPILFAMFSFFPNSIELRQEAFLWAHDLSTYDVFAKLPFTIPFYGNHVSMFTLLMTASTILYTWGNNQVSTMQGPMKFYSYLMPFIFMFIVNSMPAGLSFYYFVSNLVTFGQQAVIRKFVDDDKIRQRLEENKTKLKDKKPGGFAQRMQEAMRIAAEKEAEKAKQKKSKK